MKTVLVVDVSGLNRLRERLGTEPFYQLYAAVLRGALAPAVQAIRAAAPRFGSARRQAGALAQGITVRISRRGAFGASIGSRVGYGHLVEYGHRIVVGGRISRAKTFGGKLAAKLSGHFKGKVVGQVPPHPFAEPVVRAMEGDIARAIERGLAAALNV